MGVASNFHINEWSMSGNKCSGPDARCCRCFISDSSDGASTPADLTLRATWVLARLPGTKGGGNHRYRIRVVFSEAREGDGEEKKDQDAKHASRWSDAG